jgi:hypothetical protein
MSWKNLIIDSYERIPQELEKVMRGMKSADLDWQPSPESNSLGWTVWHLGRVQDAQIADLREQEQVYLKDNWYERFHRPADSRDTGFGHSAQDVSGFKSPGFKVFHDYIRATTDQTCLYIGSLSVNELDRILDEPWFTPRPTVAVRLVSILADCHQHVGEASYIRGLHGALYRRISLFRG